MSKIKLKRCPFCGGEATLCKIKDADLWLVKCWNRGCEMRPRTDEKETKEEAITIWNTRKPMQEIVERLEDLKQHNLNEAKKCSEFENFQVYMNDNRGFYRDNAKCYEVAIEVVKEVGGMNENHV